MNPTKKRRITDRLRLVGLWEEASAFREEVRKRLKENGEDREAATTGA